MGPLPPPCMFTGLADVDVAIDQETGHISFIVRRRPDAQPVGITYEPAAACNFAFMGEIIAKIKGIKAIHDQSGEPDIARILQIQKLLSEVFALISSADSNALKVVEAVQKALDACEKKIEPVTAAQFTAKTGCKLS